MRWLFQSHPNAQSPQQVYLLNPASGNTAQPVTFIPMTLSSDKPKHSTMTVLSQSQVQQGQTIASNSNSAHLTVDNQNFFWKIFLAKRPREMFMYLFSSPTFLQDTEWTLRQGFITIFSWKFSQLKTAIFNKKYHFQEHISASWNDRLWTCRKPSTILRTTVGWNTESAENYAG